jgi:hypothetical protein
MGVSTPLRETKASPDRDPTNVEPSAETASTELEDPPGS